MVEQARWEGASSSEPYGACVGAAKSRRVREAIAADVIESTKLLSKDMTKDLSL